jgi:hypothetical protein
MNVLLQYEDRLVITCSYSFIHTGDKNYTVDETYFDESQLPDVSVEMTVEEKIAAQSTFAFTFDYSDLNARETESIMIALDALANSSTDTFNYYMPNAWWPNKRIENPVYAEDFKRERLAFQSKVEQYMILKANFISKLKQMGFTAELEYTKLRPDYDQLVFPNEWYMKDPNSNKLCNGYIRFIFKKDSNAYTLFNDAGWIVKYSPWTNIPQS